MGIDLIASSASSAAAAAATTTMFQFESLLILILLATPLASAIAVSIIRSRRAVEIATLSSTFILLVTGIIVAAEIIERKSISAFDETFYVDSLGAIIIISIAIVGFASSLHSINYIGRQYERGTLDRKYFVRYYQGFNVFLFTMMLVPVANSAGLMWAAIEATTLISVLLIMIYIKQSSIEASWKYLVIATVGLSFALFGTILFDYSEAAQLLSLSASGEGGNFAEGSSEAPEGIKWSSMAAGSSGASGDSGNGGLWHPDPFLTKVAFIFILIGYGTKAGLAPMHTWLPDAHSEAPTPISALLSGVLLNCAMYGIIRFHMASSNAIGPEFSSQLLVILGIVSAGIAAASIYFQRDMKRMLAYSSVEHMGIISAAIGFGGFFGIYGAVLHIINHAIVKPLMFLASGSISQKYETKSIANITGVIRVMPLSGIMFLVGGLAILGMPPFNIFFSEFLIFGSAMQTGQYLPFSLLILFVALIFAGFIRHLVRMVFGSPPAGMTRGEMGKLSVIPMLLLAGLALVLGVHIPEPLQVLSNNIAELIVVHDGGT
ncbi:MAG TPA: hydrogenase 4 subunit F [Nitrososphaera sp.]|jgi:hydrogenase-4 component F